MPGPKKDWGEVFEISEKEFDDTFDTYSNNYSRFRLADGNEIRFLRKYEL